MRGSGGVTLGGLWGGSLGVHGGKYGARQVSGRLPLAAPAPRKLGLSSRFGRGG